jgi:hypothetical protein
LDLVKNMRKNNKKCQQYTLIYDQTQRYSL